jgi:hypothetical protein
LRGFVGQPVITDRNTIFLLPPLLLLAGYGLTCIKGLRVQRAIGLVLVLVSVWVLVADLDYYERIKKNQFREMAAAMGEFEPTLPVYTFKYNDTKYNVYFEQQQSGLVAKDASELESLLSSGTAPALFWLADGHGRSLQTDIDERYGLIEAGRYRFKGTFANLLINPAAATQLTVQAVAGMPAVFASASLPASRFPLQLLVALDQTEREAFAGSISIDLIAADDHVISSFVSASGAMPIVLPLGMVAEGNRIRVSLTGAEQAPRVWLITD